MLVDTTADDCLVPEALDRVTAEEDGEYETEPPSYQDAASDYRHDREAFDGKYTMVECEQRQPRHRDGTGKDYLDRPIIEEEFFNVVQTQHQLVPPKPEVDCDNLVDVESVSQDQGNNDQEVVDTVLGSRNPSSQQAQYDGNCGDNGHHGDDGNDLAFGQPPYPLLETLNTVLARILEGMVHTILIRRFAFPEQIIDQDLEKVVIATHAFDVGATALLNVVHCRARGDESVEDSGGLRFKKAKPEESGDDNIQDGVGAHGPGFDVLGVALTRFLVLEVDIDPHNTTQTTLNCIIHYQGEGEHSQDIDLAPDRNLLTRVALYVLRCHDLHEFPAITTIHIKNDIPLGRGLGSSGAAVVAGVVLGNEVGKLGLSKDRMLDFCLMIERHPDNVAAALYGSFVGTFLTDLDPEDMARTEIPLSEVLPAPAGGLDTGLRPPIPPLGIGNHMSYPWSPEIKAIVIVPDFANARGFTTPEVSTAKAREVLPAHYPRADVVRNTQRIAILTHALGQSPPDPDLIYSAMQDVIHQPYRQKLIPGLTEILLSVKPRTHPGLLGICLSGAGPTILALATGNFDQIAQDIIEQFAAAQVKCSWSVLMPAREGATVTR
ncbi:MAG: hypothetical protein Q9182_003501 [Xanthomendoza sp. 2 TL-2023]